MGFVHWFASVFAIAISVGLVASPHAVAADRPIMPDLELEALKEAVRWPKADVQPSWRSRADSSPTARPEGLAYFRERARVSPTARCSSRSKASSRRVGGRRVAVGVAWVKMRWRSSTGGTPESRGPSVLPRTRARRAPGSLREDSAAVTDLSGCSTTRNASPSASGAAPTRAWRSAYTTLGREPRPGGARRSELRVARHQPANVHRGLLAQRGTASASARRGSSSWRPGVSRRPGLRLRRHRLRLTDEGVVAIDAGTTDGQRRAALQALRRVTRGRSPTSSSRMRTGTTSAAWGRSSRVRPRVIAQAGSPRSSGRQRDRRALPLFLRGGGQRAPIRAAARSPVRGGRR